MIVATLLKPIEKNDYSYLFLLFPAAAAPAPATLLKPIEKMIVATFSSCFLLLLLLLLLLLQWQVATPKIKPSNHSQQQIPIAVKDGKASKLQPKTA